MSQQWRSLVNAVVYLAGDRALSDATAADLAARLVANPLWELTREQQHRYLTEASQSKGQFLVDVPTRHAGVDVRDFVIGLAARMDDLRPWPPLPFQQLPVRRWDEAAYAADMQAIARIDRGALWVQNILGRGFVRSAATNHYVLPLLLRSGAEVAFVGQYWPASNDTALVRMNSIVDPEQIVHELLSVTKLPPERITPVEQGW